MEGISENADCSALRLFVWNEKLTKDQISQSQGLCVCIIRSIFTLRFPSGFSSEINTKCSTVIPFDLSKLLKRDISLGPLLLSATLQFLPQTIKQLGDDISKSLFTQFQFTQDFLKSPRRPTYVIALEISRTRCFDYGTNVSIEVPPSVPMYRPFEVRKTFTVHNVSAADYRNDPYKNYTEDVLKYLDILKEYTGEGGIFPTKPPIAADLPRGFFEVQPSTTPIGDFTNNPRHEDLTGETCPVCYEEFKDNNEVIATYCSHTFHTKCLLPWLSKKNTCPICRAVYPLHYSPSLDRQHCKRKRDMLEA